jgi:chorismate mutase
VKTDDELTERLTAIADELTELDVKREQLFAERLSIWQALRGRKWKQRAIAKPSRVGEGAVTQALRKVRIADSNGS